MEDPRSEVKTKSKRRTKALRLTSPCVDQRYKAMWKTKIHGEEQGHEREPTMGLTKLKSIQKRREVRVGNLESRWNQIQHEDEAGMRPRNSLL